MLGVAEFPPRNDLVVFLGWCFNSSFFFFKNNFGGMLEEFVFNIIMYCLEAYIFKVH